MKINRQDISKYENLLNEAITLDDTKIEEKYLKISEIVNYLKNTTKDLEANKLEKAIFLVGPSGAGKSSMMNHLAGEDNLIIKQNLNGELMLEAVNSVTQIGVGKGSTTLFPTTWSHPNLTGSILDCAGEGDTGGVIVRAILSLIKSFLAKQIKQAKLLFVTSQASLGQQAGYGKVVKESLDTNSIFLNDINHFKNSFAFVISHAETNLKTHNIVKNLIKTIIDNHPNLGNYKDVVKHVLEQEELYNFSRIATFCKPNSDSEGEGEIYEPPSWKGHPPQREKIINMVQNLPFSQIPKDDFFQVSFDNEVQKQMTLALDIVKMKASYTLANAIGSDVTIFSVELNLFNQYLNELMSSNTSTDIKHFLKILQWNEYFKIDKIQQTVEELDNEMEFILKFVKPAMGKQDDDQKQHPIKENWLIKAIELKKEIGQNLNSIQEQLHKTINEQGNNFQKFKQLKNIKIISAYSSSSEISNNLETLYKKYQEKKEMELKKSDQNSQYFKDEKKQELDIMKKVKYMDTVPCVIQETYSDVETYFEQEKYFAKETRMKPETRYRTPEKTEPVFVDKTIEEMVPVTKYRTETYVEEVRTGTRYNYFLWWDYNHRPIYKPVTKEREVPYTDFEIKQVKQKVFSHNKTVKDYTATKIPYQILTEMTENVEKFRPVQKQRRVSKTRSKESTKQIEKEKEVPVFKELDVKVFDQEQYDKDMKIN
ncbi:hypothetical protein ABPG72_001074 [Tetrahymena utriculariae]